MDRDVCDSKNEFYNTFIYWRYLREVDRGGVVFRFLFARTPDAVTVGDVVTNQMDACLWCCLSRGSSICPTMRGGRC